MYSCSEITHTNIKLYITMHSTPSDKKCNSTTKSLSMYLHDYWTQHLGTEDNSTTPQSSSTVVFIAQEFHTNTLITRVKGMLGSLGSVSHIEHG